MLYKMVKKYTGKSNEQCIDVVAKRFAYKDASAVAHTQLMELDAAMDVMDHNDANKSRRPKKLPN